MWVSGGEKGREKPECRAGRWGSREPVEGHLSQSRWVGSGGMRALGVGSRAERAGGREGRGEGLCLTWPMVSSLMEEQDSSQDEDKKNAGEGHEDPNTV